MPKLFLRRFLVLWLFCFPAVLLLGSCSAARVHQQNILFRADGVGRLDTAKLRDVVNRAERNYIIQPNDYLEVRVYTNEGERILDPNGELQFGSMTGAGNAGGAGSIGSSQPQSGLGGRQGGQQQQNQQNQNSNQFLVQHDGVVRLPMVGYQRLTGLTLLQADSLLQTKYTEFYKGVFVTTRVANNRIIVLGATSGGSGQVIQMFNDNMNLLEVLAMAGGIDGAFVGTTASGRAGRADNIRLIRGSLKNPQVQVIDLTTIDGMRRANLQVEPNDIIYVEPIRRPFYEGLQDATPLFSLIASIAGVVSTIYLISRLGSNGN
ncbi:polysaccharide biosynthesis/export family protein [Hymenobacter lapidiphilus]|uniref:Polysaccharide biosynthesis/export family protein n=1 Tax=Hymenobacter lapidiphilus TaxID=2608003 RepID=A0A7Y7PLP7_9BACT|nr:polysaccharide biosynthesis/export family protein [Hymenobacter lapidiphilus]NVO30141.1 polysaccharide biosynthesis/export family protein [Hymenobacter lapidiphilus]